MRNYQPFRASTRSPPYRLTGVSPSPTISYEEPPFAADRWPVADQAFREDIARSYARATTTPLVWARIRTAPRYPSMFEVETERYSDYDRYRKPRDPSWPPDFTGAPAETLQARRDAAPGAELIEHIPPGDGWHRIAWVRFDYPNISAVDLLCECSIQQLHHPDGHTESLHGNEKCAYKRAAAHLRALSRQREFPHPVPTALRDMLDLALAGDWLGQPSGSALGRVQKAV